MVKKVDQAEQAAENTVVKEKKVDGRKNNGAHLRVPDELKKTKPYVPTGKPRGRRKGQTKAVIKAERAAARKNATPYVPTGKPRGRPKKVVAEE